MVIKVAISFCISDSVKQKYGVGVEKLNCRFEQSKAIHLRNFQLNMYARFEYKVENLMLLQLKFESNFLLQLINRGKHEQASD